MRVSQTTDSTTTFNFPHIELEERVDVRDVILTENKTIKGSLTGISIGKVTQTQKIKRSFQALGAIAFAYSYSLILIEIQDTIKSPPAEHKTMKRATLIRVVTATTVFYMFCGCFGYAAFGGMAPGNLLIGFGFYNPYWLLDIVTAYAEIVLNLPDAIGSSSQSKDSSSS